MIQVSPINTGLKDPKQTLKPTILIVDDQEMVRTMIADLLGEMNYNVLTAKEGIDAV